MRGSASRLAAVLLAVLTAWAAFPRLVPAQQTYPPLPPQPQHPSVTAIIDDVPISQPTAQPTTAPLPANDLKETEDRLHAFETENEALRRRNDLSNQTIRTLSESLAVANAECEVFRRQYGELKLRMEALGLASVGDNKEALEQRLLKAVRDLDLTRDDKDKLAERLVALSETVLLALKTASVQDPQIRMQVEEQLRAANESLNTPPAPANTPDQPLPDLENGKVISVKEEYSLLVANLGEKQGVKIGMPFQIVRGEQAVGRARVIDVRERISGAVVEEYSSNTEKVKVGDQLRVDAQP